MKRIDARLAGASRALHSAAGFRGVGIPDSVADARRRRGAAAAFVVIAIEREHERFL